MQLPLLAVKNIVLFPGLNIPLYVGRNKSLAAVEHANKTEDKTIIVVTQRKPEVDNPGSDDLFTVGTKAIIRKIHSSDKGMEITVQGVSRVRLTKFDSGDKFLKCEYEELPLPKGDGPEVEGLFRTILQDVKQVEELTNAKGGGLIGHMLNQIQDPLTQIYLLTAILNIDTDRSQQILESPTLMGGMNIVYEYLTHEIQVLEVQSKIASRTQTQLNQQQREHILRQQLEAIRAELGEGESGRSDVETLKDKLEKAKLPEHVKKEADRELKRLEQMPAQAAEFQLLRSYLEFIAEMPWSKVTEDKIDIKKSRDILNADHYDLEDVKERILEHLAVIKLNPQAKAPIICFVGPPGVGKTSLGESIARALGRKFERMSLGGLHDEAELRGHRRTYVGAMPGRILQAIRRAGVANPVLMLDEVDKVGRDFRGDPTAALMEILDPSQNFAFRDNYLDLPFDLSKVFFILTSNSLDTIPTPLLDRLEVIRLAGYTEAEKTIIAQKYLLPIRVQEAGLKPEQMYLSDEVVSQIVREYTREAGLRELSRLIGKIARKIAMQIAEGTENITVNEKNLSRFLGPARFFKDQARGEPMVGVSTGLAYTPVGGDVIYIEASLLPGGKGLTLTGQLGDVMKESARAAQSFIWTNAKKFQLPPELFEKSGVHVHVPEGATPKDGPSAGVTMATALASLYSGVPARADTAMTGEITLSGLVLPIGGLKEKALAAHRAGIKRIVVPKGNQKDIVEIPNHVLEGLEIVFVENLDQVFANTLTSDLVMNRTKYVEKDLRVC